MRRIFLGDVMGRAGRAAIAERLAGLRVEWGLDFVVVNGENASSGAGLTPEHAKALLAAGADCLTLGDHAFDHRLPLLWCHLRRGGDRPRIGSGHRGLGQGVFLTGAEGDVFDLGADRGDPRGLIFISRFLYRVSSRIRKNS